MTCFCRVAGFALERATCWRGGDGSLLPPSLWMRAQVRLLLIAVLLSLDFSTGVTPVRLPQIAASRSAGQAAANAPDGTPEQIHLTWGDDPTRTVHVSWASASQSNASTPLESLYSLWRVGRPVIHQSGCPVLAC